MACSKKTLAFDVALNVPAEALWKGLENGGDCPLPALVPEVYAAVEGPWFEEGGVVHAKFNNGMADCQWTHQVVDRQRLCGTWTSEEEGPLAVRSHHHTTTVSYIAGPSSHSSIARYSIEFDSNVSIDFMQSVKESLVRSLQILSSRLSSQLSFN